MILRSDARAIRFLSACRRKRTDCTPVWLMRQAGRYQPSYRQLRADMPFFELCRTPELAARVTVNAVEELGVDAAIIFSDILVPVIAMGAGIELTEDGPKLDRPVRDRSDIGRLQLFEPNEAVPYVMDAIRMTNSALDGTVPLIGFAGAPLTLASYLVEGGHSKSFSQLKRLLFCDAEGAHQLMDKLSTMVSRHLRAQIDAGCHAVQIFDSWAGILGPEDYRSFCVPYLQRIIEELRPCGVPCIVFGTCTGSLLELLAQTGADVIGIDWRVGLDEARGRLGANVALQGNLDPCCLFMDEPRLERRIARVLEQAGDAPGHIFNLGHGILPTTSPERARYLVDTVHRLSKRGTN